MNGRRLRLILLPLLLGALVLFCLCAPSTAPASPVFSADSGFYDDSFFLTLSGEGTIYYTLDCSDPDESSPVYASPLLLEDPSGQPNVYSAIRDVSPFLNEYLLESGAVGNNRYVVPAEPVDKAAVVRAVCVDRQGRHSEVVTKCYFFGLDEKEGYGDLPVLSLVTDPDNLFDPVQGIYVGGEEMDEYIRSLEDIGDFDLWAATANFFLRGDSTERECCAELLDRQSSVLFSGQYGLRIRGGFSRLYPAKNLNLFADRSGSLSSKVPDLPSVSQSLSIYQGNVNDKLKNYLIARLAAPLSLTVRNFVPCVLFLEGEYWGNCALTERFDDSFFREYCGIAEGNAVFIKNGALELGKERDYALYEELQALTEADLSLPENYAAFLKAADEDSWIDYYAAEIYLANIDWLLNNTALYRSRITEGGELSDARWRWILFDDDYSLLLDQVYSDSFARAASLDPLFCSLLENDGFRSALLSRLRELADTVFSPENTRQTIDALREEFREPMVKEYGRFYGGGSAEDFDAFCDGLQTFFELRHDYVLEQYGEAYG